MNYLAVCDITEVDTAESLAYFTLPCDMSERIKETKNKEERKRRAASYLLLEKLFFAVFNGTPMPRVAYTANGKPCFENLKSKKSIFFNISHSANIVAVALSCEEIGVDVQQVSDNISKLGQIEKRLLNGIECEVNEGIENAVKEESLNQKNDTPTSVQLFFYEMRKVVKESAEYTNRKNAKSGVKEKNENAQENLSCEARFYLTENKDATSFFSLEKKETGIGTYSSFGKNENEAVLSSASEEENKKSPCSQGKEIDSQKKDGFWIKEISAKEAATAFFGKWTIFEAAIKMSGGGFLDVKKAAEIVKGAQIKTFTLKDKANREYNLALLWRKSNGCRKTQSFSD